MLVELYKIEMHVSGTLEDRNACFGTLQYRNACFGTLPDRNIC